MLFHPTKRTTNQSVINICGLPKVDLIHVYTVFDTSSIELTEYENGVVFKCHSPPKVFKQFTNTKESSNQFNQEFQVKDINLGDTTTIVFKVNPANYSKFLRLFSDKENFSNYAATPFLARVRTSDWDSFVKFHNSKDMLIERDMQLEIDVLDTDFLLNPYGLQFDIQSCFHESKYMKRLKRGVERGVETHQQSIAKFLMLVVFPSYLILGWEIAQFCKFQFVSLMFTLPLVVIVLYLVYQWSYDVIRSKIANTRAIQKSKCAPT